MWTGWLHKEKRAVFNNTLFVASCLKQVEKGMEPKGACQSLRRRRQHLDVGVNILTDVKNKKKWKDELPGKRRQVERGTTWVTQHLPGPLAFLSVMRPSLKMTVRSYSCTIYRREGIIWAAADEATVVSVQRCAAVTRLERKPNGERKQEDGEEAWDDDQDPATGSQRAGALGCRAEHKMHRREEQRPNIYHCPVKRCSVLFGPAGRLIYYWSLQTMSLCQYFTLCSNKKKPLGERRTGWSKSTSSDSVIYSMNLQFSLFPSFFFKKTKVLISACSPASAVTSSRPAVWEQN